VTLDGGEPEIIVGETRFTWPAAPAVSRRAPR